MSVYARTIRSTPERASDDTWTFIVDLIAPKAGAARTELLSVTGVAASVIASEGPKDDPIVVRDGGPRVRIRCLYDEDAITGDNADEAALASSPTGDGWRLSLPTPDADLAWVQAALAKKSSKITARAIGEEVPDEGDERAPDSPSGTAYIDPEWFLRR